MDSEATTTPWRWRFPSIAEQARRFRRERPSCPICGDPATAIDHDHRTGENRGHLCDPCNKGIGFFGDSPTRLRAAAEYLERHSAVQGPVDPEWSEARAGAAVLMRALEECPPEEVAGELDAEGLRALIEWSNRSIAAYDAAHPEEGRTHVIR